MKVHLAEENLTVLNALGSIVVIDKWISEVETV